MIQLNIQNLFFTWLLNDTLIKIKETNNSEKKFYVL